MLTNINSKAKNMPEHFNVLEDDFLIDIEGSKLAYFHRYAETAKVHINMTTHCVVYVLTGEKIFHSKEGKLHLMAGDVAFIKKGLYLNTEKVLNEGKFDSIAFFLEDRMLKEFVEKNRNQLMHSTQDIEVPHLYSIMGSTKIGSYFNSLIPYFSDDQKHNVLLKLKFEELLLNLIAHDQSQIFKSFLCQLGVERKVSFENFMEHHYAQNLSIQELAFLNGMSLSSFKRIFKETYHEAPGKWLKLKRMEKARVLLERTDKAVSEICDSCGYSSASHFILQFRETFGVSPLKYRHTKKVSIG